MFDSLHRILASVAARYREPHRGHHGIAHMREVRAAVLAARPRLHFPDAAELAAVFHDAVLDPARADNEERSALLLEELLRGLVDPETLRRAAVMIRATKGHRLPEGEDAALLADCAAFLDADTAVLGARRNLYLRYARGIAIEFVPVHGRDAYVSGRSAFLRSWAARPAVFLTARMEAGRGASARANMAAELRLLLEAPSSLLPA